jgi:NAD(P)-dependent dehydrogenase (short-subunit alcohol dehydrogenase family)
MSSRRKCLALLLVVPACLTLLGLAAVQDVDPASAGSRFLGKTVVVTGANRGLGLELARQYVTAGADVVGTARNPEGATELAATGARVLQLDVADEDSVAAFAEALGESPVHLLINNAGVSGRSLDDTVSHVERVRRIMDVNTLGPMRVTDALLPNLIDAGGASIVNMSSRLGSLADNTSGGYHGYRESKAALNMYSRTLAANHREDGIIAIAVSPGWVRTDMGGPDAPLSPEESIAGLRMVIEELEADDSGKFLNHDGRELEW